MHALPAAARLPCRRRRALLKAERDDLTGVEMQQTALIAMHSPCTAPTCAPMLCAKNGSRPHCDNRRL
jgi:hypothetical protein